MKILQLCQRYHPHIGGLETHVKEISERLIQKGLDVEILTTDPYGTLPENDVVNGLKIKRFKSWAPGEAYYFSNNLKKYLKNNTDKYDIVHAHGYHAFPALYAAQTKGKNKLFFTPHYHGKGHTFFRNLLHIPYKIIAKQIFTKSEKIICVSSYEKNLIINNFKIGETKISIIPNGINLEEFKNLPKEKKDYRIILCVARLEKYKGIDYLVKVIPMLENDINLEVVGKGPYKKSLLKLVDNLKVKPRITFFEDLPREKLLHKYANANLFSLLSKYEAYGISVAEALAAKTPCIVSQASALQEWIDNENCFGISYPIILDELAFLINTIIQRNVGNVSLPDWNENVENLMKLYES